MIDPAIPEFTTFRSALLALLTDPSEKDSFDIRPSLTDPGYTDVYMNDRRVTISPPQIRAAAANESFDILAAGTLSRLRNRHSLYPQPTISVEEAHLETARILERIIRAGRPKIADKLLEKARDSVRATAPRAYAAAYQHALAFAIISLLDNLPMLLTPDAQDE